MFDATCKNHVNCTYFLSIYPPENARMSPQKQTISKGNESSSKHRFSGDMSVFGEVVVTTYSMNYAWSEYMASMTTDSSCFSEIGSELGRSLHVQNV